MDDFYIDKIGTDEEKRKNETPIATESDEDDFLNCPKIDLCEKLPGPLERKETLSKKTNINLDDTYLITNYTNSNTETNPFSTIDKLLEKSIIKEGFEKQHRVPKEKSQKALKLERKKLSQKTKGKQWFDIPATKVTEEIKTDFEVLKMRSALDKNHVYKKNDITHIPKYFMVGRVIEGPADFYGGRIPKSQRKKTMVDELLADAEFKKYQKKKFKEIMDENRKNKRKTRNPQVKNPKKKRGKGK